MSDHEIIEERGDLRVKVVHDTYPHEPENDGGCPIIRVDSDSYGGARFEHTGYGGYYDPGFDAEDVLARFAERFGWREGIEVFERYVRIFHEGSVETYNLGTWREYGYVAFTTRNLAREWGVADDKPVPEAELNEWRSYCEGDVYGVVVEERVKWARLNDEGETTGVTRDEWEEIDACWGFYGYEYAVESAREEIGWRSERTG